MAAMVGEQWCVECGNPVAGSAPCARCGSATDRGEDATIAGTELAGGVLAGGVVSGGVVSGGVVSGDLPCRRCGYSLKGLAPAGVCPECGAPVRFSLMGDFLAASSPGHVARLALGARLVEAALYPGVLMLCVGTPLTLAARHAPGGTPAGIALVFALALTIMDLGGWWMVSTRDPGHLEGGSGEGTRRTLRVCILASAAAHAAWIVGFIVAALDVPATVQESLVGMGGVAACLGGIAKYFASAVYVRALAARIPSAWLGEAAKASLSMPLWTFGLGLPLLVVAGMMASMTPPVGLVAILIFGGMATACLVWFVWYCSMVSGLRDRLDTVRAMMPRVAAD